MSPVPLDFEPQCMLIVTHQHAKWHTHRHDSSKADIKIKMWVVAQFLEIPTSFPKELENSFHFLAYEMTHPWVSFQVALVVKNLSASARDTRDMGSIPGLGRSPGVGKGNPLQPFCLLSSMDRGAWRLQSMRWQRVRCDSVTTCVLSCSVVSNSATLWTVACQAPLSMGFSRQEYWSG